MKERSILFSGPMVRAILDGRKTQTRRVVRDVLAGEQLTPDFGEKRHLKSITEWWKGPRRHYASPYGQVGDRLWVRESAWRDERASNVAIYAATPELAKYDDGTRGIVRASYPDNSPPPSRDDMQREMESNRFWHLKPSIHMPRWASRITLEVTGVRVERVQDISVEGAIAECALNWASSQNGDKYAEVWKGNPGIPYPIQAYRKLWDSLNEKRGYGWDVNPWVWVIEFKRVEQQTVAA